jgi:hypothetical protein
MHEEESGAMKAILIVTDSEAVPRFERALAERDRGFTVIPELIGKGRGGLKTGDRVHPGRSSLMFTVVPEAELDETVGLLKQARDEAAVGADTRMWAFAVEEL